MATVPARFSALDDLPELHTGDRMTRAEFHRIYEQTPEEFKAELVGGIVPRGSGLRSNRSEAQAFLLSRADRA